MNDLFLTNYLSCRVEYTIKRLLLYTECQSSIIPVSYWLKTYHVIVEKFYCLPGNVAKRRSGGHYFYFTGK